MARRLQLRLTAASMLDLQALRSTDPPIRLSPGELADVVARLLAQIDERDQAIMRPKTTLCR